MSLGHYISVKIVGNDEKHAIELLEKTIKDLKEGVCDCSEHDDTFLPYRWWTSYKETEIRNKVTALWEEN